MSVGKNLKGIIDRDGVKHAIPTEGGGGTDPSIPEQLAEKADKVNPELEGHLAVYDEHGNLGDGGEKSQFAPANHDHDNDYAPIEHSHTGISDSDNIGDASVQCGIDNTGGYIELTLSKNTPSQNSSIIIDLSNAELLQGLLNTQNIRAEKESGDSYYLYEDGQYAHADNIASAKAFLTHTPRNKVRPVVFERVVIDREADTTDTHYFVGRGIHTRTAAENNKYRYDITLYMSGYKLSCYAISSASDPRYIVDSDWCSYWTVETALI